MSNQPLHFHYLPEVEMLKGGRVRTKSIYCVDRPMRIYVGGPLTAKGQAEIERNIHACMEIGADLIERGHYPFVPHVNWYWEGHLQEIGRDSFDWDRWFGVVAAYLPLCDAFFYRAPSRGADSEKKIAEANRLIIYQHIEEVPVVRR